MNILCIGEALIDMICTDRGTSLEQGEHFVKKPGGAPTNVAAAIGAFGGSVALVAKAGDDAFGWQLKNTLQDFGVNTGNLLLDKDHFTTLAFVSLMHDGERDFIFNRGADGMLTTEETARVNLSATSIIHFGSATAFLPGPLQHAYRYLFEKARHENIFISFDPNYRPLLFANGIDEWRKHCLYFLPGTDFCKMSAEEALLITGEKKIDHAVGALEKLTTGVFCITLGKNGTLLRVKNEIRSVASIPVNSIDSTGAGDAFVGALLFQLQPATQNGQKEWDIEDWAKIVANANKAGARTCAYMGAMEAFKHLDKSIFD